MFLNAFHRFFGGGDASNYTISYEKQDKGGQSSGKKKAHQD